MLNKLIYLITFFTLLVGCVGDGGPGLLEVIEGAYLDIASTQPSNNQTEVATSTSVVVVFNRGMTTSTVTSNITDTSCSGSIQLSNDSFVTCVQMAAAPVISDGNKTFTLTPLAVLNENDQYQLKITTVVQDYKEEYLAAEQIKTFSTIDTLAPSVASTSPADTDIAVLRDTGLVVNFSEAIDTSTIVVNIIDNTCNGTIQISSDGFTTCEQFAGVATASNSDQTFTLAFNSILVSNTTYQIKVTTVVTDDVGNAMAADFLTATGFTTEVGDIVAPTVTLTSPVDTGLGVPSSPVVITFSEAMDTSTITANIVDTACSGTIQISNDNFTTCEQFSAAPVASSGDTVFTLTPTNNLVEAAVYKIKVTTAATDLWVNSMAVDYVDATGFTVQDITAPTVATTAPVDGATGQSLFTTIGVTFSEAMDTATITTNTADTTCSGTLQVSSDSFVTCVQMSAVPVATVGDTVFTITPAASLAASTNYLIRVTTGATDATSLALAANYTSVLGFTTGTADIIAPTVSSVTPADTSINIARNSTAQVVFDEAMDTATVTTNTAGTGCTGTIQLSTDGFTTCIQMSAAPVATIGDTTFTVTTLSSLASSQAYAVRVTTGVQDISGNALGAAFNSTFTTEVGDITAPTVTSTTPADTATGIALASDVLINIDEAIDTATVTLNTVDTTCSGTIQVSADGFTTCVQFAGVATFSGGDQIITVDPNVDLSPNATYQVRVTTALTDIWGNALAAQYTSPTGFDTITMDVVAPTITGIVPADTATNILISSTIAVTFDEAMDTATVTTNTADTTCSGSIQVSSDSFTTCIQMSAAPVATVGDTVFTITPAASLGSVITYQVRITTGVTDVTGNALAAVSTQATGFQTENVDVTPPTILSSNPADTDTGISVATTIAVTFDEAMDTATVTTNTADTSCSGTFQVSSDGFVTCVQMSAVPAATVGDTIFTVTPATALTVNTFYRVRITTGVTDTSGNALASTYLHATGFKTTDSVPPTVFSTLPVDGTSAIAVATTVAVTFDEPMDTATITTNTADTTCSGTFQVSSDGFTTCVQMTAVPVVSNSDQTFTITPTANLASTTVYQIRLTVGVQDVAGNAMAAQYTGALGFTTEDVVAPNVVTTSPLDAATNVVATSTVAVTFDEAMDTATLTTNSADTTCSGTFQVSSDAFTTCIQMAAAPVASVGDTVFTITPSANLASGTTYQIRITTGAQDSSGNALAAIYTTPTGFTTQDIVPPTVSSVTPADSATAIAVSSTIVVVFDEAINTGTITINTADTTCSGTVQLSSDDFVSCVQLSGTAVASVGDTTFTITPAGNLTSSTTYKVRVTIAAQDVAGNALAAIDTQANGFTTADVDPPALSSTTPADAETSVALGTLVSITFDEAMNSATVVVNTADTSCLGSFQVSSDGFTTCVQFAATATAIDSDKTFIATPVANLAASTTYQIRVTTAVTDVAGNNLAAQYTSATGFTTGVLDVTAPTVSSVTPSDGTTGVAVGTTVSITFDESVDTSTATVNTTDTTCSGAFQLSSNSFTSCIQFSSSAMALNGDKTFMLTPAASLSASTSYQIRVTTDLQDVAGNGLAAVYTSTGFTTGVVDATAPTVVSTTPSDSSTGIALGTTISITLDEEINVATTSINTADTTCIGSFQLSMDNFANCIQFTGSAVSSNGNKTFTITPAANLAASTTYKVRATTAVQDLAGNSLAADYTSTTGFTTGILDVTAPTISSVIPVDTATNIAPTSTLSVTFSEAINVATTGINSSDTTCTGSFQVSSDGFTTCVQFSGTATASNGNQTFTLTPAANLTASTAHQFRVTTTIADSAGNNLAAISTTTFTTGVLDVTAPTITSTTPADTDTGISSGTIISASFDEEINPATVVINTSSTTCSGSIQVSLNSFASCVMFTGSPMALDSDKTFVVTPAAALSTNTNYDIRITTGITDVAGNNLASTYTTPTGFTTGATKSMSAYLQEFGGNISYGNNKAVRNARVELIDLFTDKMVAFSYTDNAGDYFFEVEQLRLVKVRVYALTNNPVKAAVKNEEGEIYFAEIAPFDPSSILPHNLIIKKHEIRQPFVILNAIQKSNKEGPIEVGWSKDKGLFK